MKRFLILIDSKSEKKEAFFNYLTDKMGEDYKVYLVQFSDLYFFIDGSRIEVGINGFNIPIKEFDLVYFRRVGAKYRTVAATLAVILDHFGIKYIDSYFGNSGSARDKFTSLAKLAVAGLPVMATYYCRASKILEKRKEIIAKLGLPLVAKQVSTQRGQGVYLLKNEAGFDMILKEKPDRTFLFQKYYENDEEYRVLVLGEGIGAYEQKIRAESEEFRSNVALGATEKFIDINRIPKETKEISVKACKELGIEVGGVDILVDRAGKRWLLEVNRGPGLTYDPKVSPELENLSKYFIRLLKGEK